MNLTIFSLGLIFASEVEKRIPGAIFVAEEDLKSRKRCPCEGGDISPFYDCSLHPLISSISTSINGYERWETVGTSDCYSSSSSREDCCRSCTSSSSTTFSDDSYCSEHCKYRDVAEWNFESNKFPKLNGRFANWEFWVNNGSVIANGGELTRDCKGYIHLDSNPYDVTVPQGPNYWADHYKYFIYAKSSVALPAMGETDFEFVAKVSSDGRGSQNFPFPCSVVNSDDDVRLANGGFRVFDETGLNFAFHVTNSLIYAVYEREIKMPGVNGFAYFVPVKIRKPADVNHMKLRFDSRNKHVIWYVDGIEVFRVKSVGAMIRAHQCYLVNLLEGADFVSFPVRVQYGFGSFTFLDYYPPCRPSAKCRSDCQYPCRREGLVRTANNLLLPQFNPIEGPPELSHFYDNLSKDTSRLWGQGSSSWISSIRVIELMCYRVVHHRKRNGGRCYN